MGLNINGEFKLEKDTKGAVRFQEEGHAPAIGSLYIRKHAFSSSDYPKTVYVVVSDEPIKLAKK